MSKLKTQYTKKFCPNYDDFMKNSGILNSVVDLSVDIDAFEFNNFKESFNKKEIQYKNCLENLERLNVDLRLKLEEKTVFSNQQLENYKKYEVSLI